jgi:dihydrofolate synthase/folylpolyglutamate synthase
MTYEEARDWLFQQLPMFQRVGTAAYKADLTNTHTLMALLGHPERQFKSIHVAGTNGKGSVSHMLAAVFQQAGFKTGLYTSPHLVDFRERIRINGEPIPEAVVARFTEIHQSAFSAIGLSFFEMTVGLAFYHFATQQVDIAIIETGMGGRLDATNVIQPELSIITNIGWDHAQFLGDTLPKIAGEKAGIIKHKTPVVIGQADQDEIRNVFLDKAAEMQASITFAASYSGPLPPSDLKGPYQQANIRTVLQALSVYPKTKPDEKIVTDALLNVCKLTGLRGRWETLQTQPRVICDTGHNTHALAITLPELQKERGPHALHMVFGMVADKDVTSILEMLPTDAKYYWCKPELPRGLDAGILKQQAATIGLQGTAYKNVESAYKAALEQADQQDLIFVGGSTFVVADLLATIG